MKLYNCHIHTDASPDCTTDCRLMAEAAINCGFSGITITDHCAGSNYISNNSYMLAKNSINNAEMLKHEFYGRLEVFKGIEFDEMHWNPEYVNRLINSMDFDFVLASVHKVKKCPTQQYFSRIDFSKFSEADLYTYAGWYFEDVLETAKNCIFDSLAHMTIIKRYMCVKYGRDIDFSRFSEVIDKTLKTLVCRGKALEVNTSEIHTIGTMPDKEILKRYHSLGGELVTIGSDAHVPNRVSHGFTEAISLLKECGFKYYVYYKNRQVQKEYI